MKVLYEVRNIPRRDGCDVFIYGVDDFEPKRFETEEEAVEFISKQVPNNYTITKIYKVPTPIDLNNFHTRTDNRDPLFSDFMDYIKRDDEKFAMEIAFKAFNFIGKKNGVWKASDNSFGGNYCISYKQLKEAHPEIFQ